MSVWFGSATTSGIRRLQRLVESAEQTISALPTLQEQYTSRVRKWAQKITLDPSHPSHPFLNFCHLAGATEPQLPGQSDTRSVSSPRQFTL